MAALRPPIAVALATPGDVPEGNLWRFECKWDGWRCLVFGGLGVLQSRSGADLSRRFPEVVVAAFAVGDVVLDGELLACDAAGQFDFPALNYSPARRQANGVTILYTVFDLLADGHDGDIRGRPYQQRRARLEQLLHGVRPPIQLCPATADRAIALGWVNTGRLGAGLEGCIAKRADSPYRGGRAASGWIKTRGTVTVDLVVVGVTGSTRHPGSLVLARPHRHRRLVAVTLPLSRQARAELDGILEATGEPRRLLPGIVGGLPGQPDSSYVPVAPFVVEVEAAPLSEHGRFRHRVRHVRLRPDLEALPGRGAHTGDSRHGDRAGSVRGCSRSPGADPALVRAASSDSTAGAVPDQEERIAGVAVTQS